jgi:hypothetical protein
MVTETITVNLRRVESIRELQQLEMGKYVRKIGQVYFQFIPESGFIPRVITEHTNGPWVESQVNKKLIYVPIEKTIAEVG